MIFGLKQNKSNMSSTYLLYTTGLNSGGQLSSQIFSFNQTSKINSPPIILIPIFDFFYDSLDYF